MGKVFSKRKKFRTTNNPFINSEKKENDLKRSSAKDSSFISNERDEAQESDPGEDSVGIYENKPEEENLGVTDQGDQSQATTEKCILVARYDFEPRSNTELGVKQGERMILVYQEDDEWIMAKHEHTEQQGYVPLNYVADPTSLDIYEWYFGAINRREAEALLIRRENGTFLVREASIPGSWAISLKHATENRPNTVRHFSISSMNYYYIIWNRHYATFDDLIEDCKVTEGILPTLLTNPCPKYVPAMTDLCRETKHEWEILRSEISILQKIGQGNFGDVYWATWSRGIGQPVNVAVKTLKKGSMPDAEFLEEARIMKGLEHENILKLLATCSKEEPIYIITQYMSNGSLLTLLKRYKEYELTLDQMLEFSFQISKGMAYLEEKKLVHRDLAARNVLVDDRFTCKIADFGLAKILEKNEKSKSVAEAKFPVKWSPPEVLQEGRFSTKSDVWSFGIVMIEIFTYGDNLYPGMDKATVKYQVIHGYRPPQPEQCPTYIYELLLKCWDHNANGRPTFKDLKKYLDDSTHRPQDGTQYLLDQ